MTNELRVWNMLDTINLNIIKHLKKIVFYYINLFAYIHLSFVDLLTAHPEL